MLASSIALLAYQVIQDTKDLNFSLIATFNINRLLFVSRQHPRVGARLNHESNIGFILKSIRWINSVHLLISNTLIKHYREEHGLHLQYSYVNF